MIQALIGMPETYASEPVRLMYNCLMILTVILVTTAVMNQVIKDYCMPTGVSVAATVYGH